MDVQTSLDNCWYAHLRPWNNLSLFPREFGLKRTQVYKEQYLFLLFKWFEIMNCYTAVYSEGQIEQNIYDTLFLEARDETDSLEQVLLDRDMIRGVFEKYNIGYRMFYSGNRSYHFYLDFPSIYVPNLHAMANNFVDEMDVRDLLDRKPTGNRRGVGRIPRTYNEGTDCFAVYYDGVDPDELSYIAANNLMFEPITYSLIETDILKYLRPEDDYCEELFKPAHIAFNGMYPDCVLNIMTKLKMEHHATHDERIHLTAFLFKIGWAIDDIINVFRDASDYNPAIAEYHVRSIIGNNYNPFSCSRVKRDMYNACPFSDNGNYCHYIKNIIQQSRKIKEK